MIRLADFMRRLEAETGLEVKGSADLAAAQAEHRRDTAYVMLLGETTADSAGALPPVRQVVTLRLGVVLAIRNSRDRRGEDALTELEAARVAVRNALLGWQPADAETAGGMTFLRGQVAEFTEKTVWWQDEFSLDHLVTSNT